MYEIVLAHHPYPRPGAGPELQQVEEVQRVVAACDVVAWRGLLTKLVSTLPEVLCTSPL